MSNQENLKYDNYSLMFNDFLLFDIEPEEKIKTLEKILNFFNDKYEYKHKDIQNFIKQIKKYNDLYENILQQLSILYNLENAKK